MPQRCWAGPGPEQPEGPSGNHDYQRPASVPGLGQQGTGWRDGGGVEKGEEKTGSGGGREGNDRENTATPA